MLQYGYLIVALIGSAAAGFGGFEAINFVEVLQGGMNQSSGAEFTECERYFQKMDLTKDWTKIMLDATSKLQSGIFAGNTYELGAFDECISINDPVDEVQGKYCLGTIQINNSAALSQFYDTHSKYNNSGTAVEDRLNFVLRWSMCMPHVCTADEINKHLEELQVNFLSFDEGSCQTVATQPTLNTGDYWAIAFFAILGLIMLLSTLYDISLHYQEKRTSYPCLLAFSVFTNGRKLFQVVDNPNNLQCVAGLRAISMMWVVIGHVYLYSSMVPESNLMDMLQWYLTPGSMYVSGATVSVDTFFLLGGMVMVYVYLGTKSDFKILNIPAYYLHRYLRLTPVLAVMVLIHVTLLEKMGSGPFWKSPANSVSIDFCKDYWWSTLLYIQNYTNSYQLCIGVSWYLCLDMQMFVLSPLILIPLKKYTKVTLTAVVLLACGSVVAAIYISWYYQINPLLQRNGNPTYITKYYTVLWTRAAPWLIGIILGYYVYQVRNVRSIKLNKLLVAVLWIASLTVLCVCVFSGNKIVTTQKDNLAATTMYTALVRPSWAIALSWVVFACVSGYGGPINTFLSLSVFQIIARVSYSIYLTHFTVLGIVLFSARVPLHFSDIANMLNFWSYFMVIFFISVVFTLAFESPIIIIEKAVRNRGKTENLPHVQNIEKVAPQV